MQTNFNACFFNGVNFQRQQSECIVGTLYILYNKKKIQMSEVFKKTKNLGENVVKGNKLQKF